MKKRIGIFILILIIISLAWYMVTISKSKKLNYETLLASSELKVATFAGGCFWCMEAAFEVKDGVEEAVSGYTGGKTENPTYSEVTTGNTGHLEAVQVFYDPNKISYEELLEVFWQSINPTDTGGQFADRGTQYETAVFYLTEEEKGTAEKSKQALDQSGTFEKPVVTPILKAVAFYPAEENHQDYWRKNYPQYKAYEKGSGRKDFIEETWGETGEEQSYEKPSEKEIKSMLTPEQYEVTQACGTEKPFDNAYWDNKADGIYVDVVTGEPLFSSLDKYDSGTGWSSFTKPLEKENIVEEEDFKLLVPRTEVKSKTGDSHLGHVFDDGPGPGGDRYCINSAALKFIPKEDLEKEGYGQYLSLFN